MKTISSLVQRSFLFVVILGMTQHSFGMVQHVTTLPVALEMPHQPLWNDALDFRVIEMQLTELPIKSIIEMHVFLTNAGKTVHYTNEVYLAELENGLYAVWKPEDELHDSYAEVAFYRASQKLGMKNVPPTVFKSHRGRRGSLQFFVVSPYDLLKPADYKKAWAKVSAKDASDMHIIRFVLGQWDIHRGNLIIADTNDGVKIAVIDNGAVANWIQCRYGEHAYVRRLVSQSYKPDVHTSEPFPFDAVRTLPLLTTLVEAQQSLPDFPLDRELIRRWNNLGAKSLQYVVWDQALWIPFYRGNKDIKPDFTDFYTAPTIAALSAMGENDFRDCFKEALIENAPFCNESFFQRIMTRRKEVLLHFCSLQARI